jgi:hypothetical protein
VVDYLNSEDSNGSQSEINRADIETSIKHLIEIKNREKWHKESVEIAKLLIRKSGDGRLKRKRTEDDSYGNSWADKRKMNSLLGLRFND